MEVKIDQQKGTSGRFERNLINIELFTSLKSSVCSVKFFRGQFDKWGKILEVILRDFLGYVEGFRKGVQKNKPRS